MTLTYYTNITHIYRVKIILCNITHIAHLYVVKVIFRDVCVSDRLGDMETEEIKIG